MRTMLRLAACSALALVLTPAMAQDAPSPAALRDAALNDDKVAWDIVSGLTTEIGPRLAASADEARARDWAVAKLKALGFANVHIETYQMPAWERGVETGYITTPFPQKLTLTALGNSGATPAEGIEAEIVYFQTFQDLTAAPDGSLKGKIAFVSNAMTPTQDGSSYGAYGAARFVGPNIAAKKGALAIVIKSIGTDHHRVPHTGQTNFEAGVKPIPAAALSVPDAEQLERVVASGKPVRLKLVLTPKFVGMRESGNVVADVPGSDPDAGMILVGGHLDSWDLGTGAIDDGAGVAITTAAAKHIMDAGKPRRTIRVVWFGAEEPGGFGGKAFAKAHAGERYVLAGESDFGADRVWQFATSLPDAAKPAVERMKALLAVIGVAPARSDRGDFGTDVGPTIEAGTPGIGMAQSGLRYFDLHHTADDTLDKIDSVQLRQNVAAWTAMLAVMANAPEDLSPPKH